MRTYPRNSPEAAARVVAVALLADAHLCARELDLLEQNGTCERLGMDRPQLNAVVQHLAEDLMSSGSLAWSGTGAMAEDSLRGLLDEITDPALRQLVLDLCIRATHSDNVVSEAESELLGVIERRWGCAAAPAA